MPNRKIEPEWKQRAWSLAATSNLRARRIRKKWEEEYGLDIPSERWIETALEEFDGLPDEEKRGYLAFRWPHSMVFGLIPWEAGEVALDVLRRELLRNRVRPSVREVLWHWRLSLAKPDLSWEDRDAWVNGLLVLEKFGRSPPSYDLRLALSAEEQGQLFPDGLPGEVRIIHDEEKQ